MNVRISKSNITYCAVCDEVSELKKSWDDGQQLLVDNGEQEETTKFPGVPGYVIKDADDLRYNYNEICNKCMHTLMRGVSIIEEQGLTGVSLETDK